jgi:hypothetical protein
MRPNVGMLVSDNQSADSLGCYGNTEHETPRIDRLAREGSSSSGRSAPTVSARRRVRRGAAADGGGGGEPHDPFHERFADCASW